MYFVHKSENEPKDLRLLLVRWNGRFWYLLMDYALEILMHCLLTVSDYKIPVLFLVLSYYKKLSTDKRARSSFFTDLY